MNNLASNPPARRRARRSRHGVGLVELLVALSISAALLTSVAVAVDASFKAYAVNENQAQLMQRSRLAMNRMLTYIRSTDQHLPDDDDAQDDFQAGRIVTCTSIRMMLDTTKGVIFRQSGNALQMVPFTVSGNTLTEGTAHTLLDGVGTTDFRVTMEPQLSAGAQKTGSTTYDQLRRASIVLTAHPTADTTTKGEIDSGGESVTVSTSVVPRKNIW